MKELRISFAEGAIRFDGGRPILKRNQRRFEWLALLAYRRTTTSPTVTLDEISKLPHWKGISRHDSTTYLGRYLRSCELAAPNLIRAEKSWVGPYTLNVDSLAIRFDISDQELRNRLRIPSMSISETPRNELVRFVFRYVRAQWLFFQGRLRARTSEIGNRETAYGILTGLAHEENVFGSTLRLLAQLSAVNVLFRLGSFTAARKTLLDTRELVRKSRALSLKARFHLALAWAFQRASTGVPSNRSVETCLRRAQSQAEMSGDCFALGLLSYRKAGYLTKRGRYFEAINEYAAAVEAFVIVGNYNSVVAACADLGSTLHRLGEEQYDEARRWLLTSIAISRLMRLGRDDAHAETILGKIYLEKGKKSRSRCMLKRAERIAKTSGNRVNLGDTRMVWGLWCQRFGTRSDTVQAVASALDTFGEMPEFDLEQKRTYLKHCFPTVWELVLKKAKKTPKRRRPPRLH
jgi:tetratricopeptide (TPR) repeat protein